MSQDESHGTLQYLLELDRSCETTHSILQVFGDSYLCAHNHTFGSIRRAAIEIGTTFSSENVLEFLSFPMIYLDRILETKTIPFIDTRKVLERCEVESPAFWNLDRLRSVSPARNFLAHEAAHVVALVQFEELVAPISRPESGMIFHIFSEAFANTTDLLVSLEATGNAPHGLFGKLNCYANSPSAAVGEAIGYLAREVGYMGAIEFLVIAFALVNSGFAGPTLGHVREILSLISRESKHAEGLFAALAACYSLNPRFALSTNPVYLDRLGYGSSLKENVEPLKWLASQSALETWIRSLAGLICPRGAF